MIILQHKVSAEQANLLEDYFCNWILSPWTLEKLNDDKDIQLCGYFDEQDKALETWKTLKYSFKELPDKPNVYEIEDKIWKESYKKHFLPWSSRGFHWVPVWEKEKYNIPEGESHLLIDPGMAFGTGKDATTRLCLERILSCRDKWGKDLINKKLIDAGSGSGILSLSAGVMGFGDIVGFDNDKEAVNVSNYNIKLNPAESKIEFKKADIYEGLTNQTADVVVANIQSDTLKNFAELFIKSVKPNGFLILSGILKEEADAVLKKYAKEFRNQNRKFESDSIEMDMWADLCFTM